MLMQSKKSKFSKESPSPAAKSRPEAASASEEAITESLKAARLPALRKLFVETLEYDQAPFQTKPAVKFKDFARALLLQLESSFDQFSALTAAEQRAAVALTSFAPPSGSVAFFKQRVSCQSDCVCSDKH